MLLIRPLQVLSLIVILLLLAILQDAYDAGYNPAEPQKPRGRVLIISNHSFSASRLPTRDGTEVDVQRLTNIFAFHNFEVVVHHNVTSEVSDVLLRIDCDCQYSIICTF